MTSATAPGVAETPAAPRAPRTGRSVTGTRRWVAALFLLPALVLLGALVVYPIGYSIVRSFYDNSGDHFAGFDNYTALFTDDGIRTALKNNIIWVVFAPAVATALGLIFAVLTERVRWGTAFKLVVFMPMAISMLAAGIIFRLVYDQDPDKGVANAVWVGIHDTFAPSSAFPKAHPGRNSPLEPEDGGFVTTSPVHVGQSVALPLVGVAPEQMPDDAKTAVQAPAEPGKITGTTWQDFTRGKGVGKLGAVDSTELGYAGMRIEAVKDGKVVATTKAAADGTFTLPAEADGAVLRLPASNFTEPYNGVDWLGPALVTPAIVGAYVWMWAGFAMVLIAAGLASVPRELLEAARVDGCNEWQVFRRITVPVLAPVLGVVVVTLMINVLKIFDLVFIIAPGSSQDDANVLALELYRKGFSEGRPGVASAIAVFLLVLVIPVMLFNMRRLRREVRR
ncbi:MULTISPECIES: carbohydrate ABC transporter permease [Streptomyces]|jgi:alpha-glucoside transport system permease protein|uniref:Sugar ABC transporter permease n=1 Tax=Streptomyces thermoviolaceus subsp. thermoviolaceus TaxID=66860 RepID=A0ABX0YV23_STRTL|nr:sugar ABC transporter permease [Streptomyces thermoviolaceus]RSS00301.1 sugar ABC transporter permease [Streptomyces sp. WAC00469]GGV74057.1 ABC transporter permease [Streptomyces thermoviolaceus subsp. apingens]MCM3265486.1 sugar ABC transporter permease [Streptomyces thermoviolaceus]NJP16179.1 sugar ABC transporter permease [Streptomyces thermoviolaceus subsp. thermoviolaceus]GHB07983.1 ABC transporter permease [Streptomyces thermoviolaceus subsp. thermoviolaceus]